MSGHPRLWNADDAVFNLFGIPESQITAATEAAGRAKKSLGVGRRGKNQGLTLPSSKQPPAFSTVHLIKLCPNAEILALLTATSSSPEHCGSNSFVHRRGKGRFKVLTEQNGETK